MAKQNIFLIGPMGVGKTSIGRELARHLGLKFFDSDHEIEASTGANITWIFDVEGEVGFRNREEKAIDELTQKQYILLSTGGGSVARAENRKLLSARGTVIYLYASLESQLKRTAYDANRPLLQVENKRETLEKLHLERSPLYEEIADYKYDTTNQSVKTVVDAILRDIK